LIRQGAKLVETVQDILDELSWVSSGKTPVSVSAATPDDSILALIGFDPCSLDDLSERAGLSIATLSPRLLQLELEGRLASLPGGRIQRLSKV
jgi:DNA processing protein